MTQSIKQQIAFHFNRAAHTYEQAAVMQQEVGTRLCERLEYIKLNPKRVLDLGCGTGIFTQELKRLFPQAHIMGVDFAADVLTVAQERSEGNEFICADADTLPFENNSIDVIFSNLMLQWSLDAEKTLAEIFRVLSPNGVVLFSTLGPDTLQELRASFKAVNLERVNPFYDMHIWGDVLLRTGFRDPVVNREDLVLQYKTVERLLRDLRETGADFYQEHEAKTFLKKSTFQTLKEFYKNHYAEEGLLPATYEVIYGYAVKMITMPKQNQEAYIPVSQIKRTSVYT